MKAIKGTCCKKCKSKNVYLENDMGTWYEHCLICGYIAPLEEIEPVSVADATWPKDVSFDAENLDFTVKSVQPGKKKRT